jgi:hypothetical protein
MRIRLYKVLLGLGLIAGGVMVGHNVNVYHGTDQWVGVTWGTAGGCELGPLAENYGWPIAGNVSDYFGCWSGISD